MSFFSRLFGRKSKEPASRLEQLLLKFAQDPHLADRMIHESKEADRLMMAVYLACLNAAYALTQEVKESVAAFPRLDQSSEQKPFPFDPVAREFVAFTFFSVMSDHLSVSDDDDEAEESEDSELFIAIKRARYLAESTLERYTDLGEMARLKGRLLNYSLANRRRQNLFELVAANVHGTLTSGAQTPALSMDAVATQTAVQLALSSRIIPDTKSGIEAIYGELQVGPRESSS